jgi:glutamate-1-semialdehyde 2,1-aminomutase
MNPVAHKQKNADLDEALEQARLGYARRRPESQRAFANATQHMPGGNTRTVLFHGPFPLRIAGGEGARLRDIDGHSYVNLLGEFTAGIFGHSHPVIRQAILEALDRGINLSGHTQAEVTLAELIRARFPSIDLIRFTNSGTEANLMAVTTARIATGRGKVMVFSGGYHGGLLYFGNGGSPVNVPFPYVVACYNDVDATRALVRKHGSDLACVLVEPMIGSGGCIPGTPEFLRMLRHETSRCGASLIFDEVMTSRLAHGGAQELFGIVPDLTTLGKYLGGGMSFGAFGGARDFMRIYDPRVENYIPHAGTFNNNALTMAAGSAALSEILTRPAMDALNARGNGLRERLNARFVAAGVRLRATGMGSMLNIHALDADVIHPDELAVSDDRVKELLFLDLLEAGYYVARRGFIALSLEVSDADVAGFEAVIGRFIAERLPYLTHHAFAAFRRGTRGGVMSEEDWLVPEA